MFTPSKGKCSAIWSLITPRCGQAQFLVNGTFARGSRREREVSGGSQTIPMSGVADRGPLDHRPRGWTRQRSGAMPMKFADGKCHIARQVDPCWGASITSDDLAAYPVEP
jgi:hypothetical protein